MPHLVDTTLFFAPQSGGVKRYLLQKQQALQGRWRHTLLVPGAQDSALTQDCVTLRSPRIPFGHGYRLPLSRKRWAIALQALQPDLIEAADPYLPAWAALDAGQTLGVPVIGFVHSDLPRLLTDRFGSHAGRLAEIYLKRLYRHCDLVLAPSEGMAGRLRALDISRVQQQALGVDGETFHPRQADPTLRQTLGLAPQTRLLIYAGRFAREKNLPVLFEAVRLLDKDVHLLLVGAGMALPKQERVHIWPYQADSRSLARLLASCELFVHPGDQESFGLSVLEAMACATPVIGVAAGGVAELIDPSCGLLIRPRCPRSLAEAIQHMLGQDLPRLGRHAREKVLTQYDWNQAFARLIGHYDALLQPPLTCPPVSL